MPYQNITVEQTTTLKQKQSSWVAELEQLQAEQKPQAPKLEWLSLRTLTESEYFNLLAGAK